MLSFITSRLSYAVAAGLFLCSLDTHAQGQGAEHLYRRALAATCANCHGTDGKSEGRAGIPLLSQLKELDMLAQLLAFKSGARTGTIMPQLTKGYSDEQLQTIANVLGAK